MGKGLSVSRTRWYSWAAALAATSMLVLASSGARADGTDHDGDIVPDDVEAKTQRAVLTEVYPSPAPWGLSILSQSSGAPVDDKFRIKYEDGGFEMRYFRNASSGPYTEYGVQLRNLIEWVDENADGRLQEPEIVASLTLGSSAFENGSILYSGAPSTDGGHVDVFIVRGRAGESSQVDLILTVAERFLRLTPDRILTPMEVKLDVYVNHTLERAGARVGLELAMDTDSSNEMSWDEPTWDAQHGFSKDESWINVTNADQGSTMFFSWANTAVVDDVEGAVTLDSHVTLEGSERSYDLILLYPAGASGSVRIVHDPTFGVVSTAYEGILNLPPEPRLVGDLSLYTLSLAGIAAVLASTVLLARRRRES